MKCCLYSTAWKISPTLSKEETVLPQLSWVATMCLHWILKYYFASSMSFDNIACKRQTRTAYFKTHGVEVASRHTSHTFWSYFPACDLLCWLWILQHLALWYLALWWSCKQIARTITNFFILYVVWMHGLRLTYTHFFSPSNKRNDSNVGGAFIFTVNEQLTLGNYHKKLLQSFITIPRTQTFITYQLLGTLETRAVISRIVTETVAQRNCNSATSDTSVHCDKCSQGSCRSC